MKLWFFDWLDKFLGFENINQDVIVNQEPMELWDKYKDLLDNANINTPLRKAHFFGQIKQESNFKSIAENLNYSTSALVSLFGRHRISVADAEKYGRNNNHPANQKVLANILYGGGWGLKNLGNKYPNDGWNFRGRGFKQITGRYNYTKLSERTGVDYVNNPDWLLREKDSMIAAIDFWKSNNLNKLADKNDVVAVTKVINGGNNGLSKRIQYTNDFLKIFS